jgi:tetratricopeptide (TPR) repeat protein
VAYRVKDKYPSCSIFWILASSLASIEQSYLDIGQLLRIPGIEDQTGDVKKLVHDWLSKEATGQWLLIVDNADDSDLWLKDQVGITGSRLIDYLPKSNKASIIFTTRDLKAASKFAGPRVVTLVEVEKSAAKDILKNALRKHEVLADDKGTDQLLQELAFLPLAIVQAAAYINENDIPISDYISLLKSTEEDIVEILGEDFQDDGRYQDLKNPIVATWLISFERLKKQNPLASEYLSFMSCINPKAIPLSFLPSAPSKKLAIDAIGALKAYSFIKEQTRDGLFDFHRLVHLATRNWLRMEGSLADWTLKAVNSLAEICRCHGYGNRPLWTVFWPHAQYLCKSPFFPKRTRASLTLVMKSGESLVYNGRDCEAEFHVNLLREICNEIFGAEDPLTLGSRDLLANLYSLQGRLDEAEKLELEVLELSKKVLGAEHPNTLRSMSTLASVFHNQTRLDEAEKLALEAMELSKKVLGAEHPDTLRSMSVLAVIYRARNYKIEASQLMETAFNIQSKFLPPNHPVIIFSWKILEGWRAADNQQGSITAK